MSSQKTHDITIARLMAGSKEINRMGETIRWFVPMVLSLIAKYEVPKKLRRDGHHNICPDGFTFWQIMVVSVEAPRIHGLCFVRNKRECFSFDDLLSQKITLKYPDTETVYVNLQSLLNALLELFPKLEKDLESLMSASRHL